MKLYQTIKIDISSHYSLQLSLDQQPSPRTQVTGQKLNNSCGCSMGILGISIHWVWAHHLHIQLLPPAPAPLTTITFESNEPWEKLISWRRADLVSESKAGTDIIPGTCGFLPPQIHIVKTGPDPKFTNFQDVKMSVLIRVGGDDKQTTASEGTDHQPTKLTPLQNFESRHWPNITEHKAHRSNATHRSWWLSGPGLTTLITTSHKTLLLNPYLLSTVPRTGLWTPPLEHCEGVITLRAPRLVLLITGGPGPADVGGWEGRVMTELRTLTRGHPRLKLQCRGWGCERPGLPIPAQTIYLNLFITLLNINVTLNRNVFYILHFS